jgi:hypothetical protein
VDRHDPTSFELNAGGMVVPVVFRKDGDGQIMCLGHPMLSSAAGRGGGVRGSRSEPSPPLASRPPRSRYGERCGGGRRVDPQLAAKPRHLRCEATSALSGI